MNAAYEAYLQSKEWHRRRIGCLSRAGFRCETCGSDGGITKTLHAHHLTYARIFNEQAEDLMCLCRTCHESVECIVKGGDLKRNGCVKELRRKTLSFFVRGNHKKSKRPAKQKPKVTPIIANGDAVVLTINILKTAATNGCGFNGSQLKLLGVTYQSKGWMKTLIGKSITPDTWQMVLRLRGVRNRKDRKEILIGNSTAY